MTGPSMKSIHESPALSEGARAGGTSHILAFLRYCTSDIRSINTYKVNQIIWTGLLGYNYGLLDCRKDFRRNHIHREQQVISLLIMVRM